MINQYFFNASKPGTKGVPQAARCSDDRESGAWQSGDSSWLVAAKLHCNHLQV
jgi:hypothetical protein